MVKLVWEDKNNITSNIEKLKRKYLSRFKKSENELSKKITKKMVMGCQSFLK